MPSPNQDAYSFTALSSGWNVCVVCDGHGEAGEILAERVARSLPLFFSEHLHTGVAVEAALSQAFLDAQADLEQHFRRPQIQAGSTATLLAQRQGETWLAYAGDSKAVLADLATGCTVFHTEDHKAHDPAESARLKSAGAQVIEKRYEDGEVLSRIFVPRTGVPGLAMSRSLGDGCLKRYGVTAEPDVHEVSELWSRCQAPLAVIASDGLWDTISVEDTVKALSTRHCSGLNVGIGAEALTRRAQRLWIECEGDYCDDVTILLFGPEGSYSGRKET